MPVVKSKLSKRAEIAKPIKAQRQLSLGDFCRRRNKILIVRAVGGLGDILMHRMMFEDFKLLMPDAEIHFACPAYYHDAVNDHPFVDKVLSSENLDRYEYLISYNTSTACGRYEMRIAPKSDLHRSDIWAKHCGVSLTKHDMHFRLTDSEKAEGRRLIEEARDRDGPVVLVAPVSAMIGKNLTDEQIAGTIEGLRERGCCPIGLHNSPILQFLKKDWPLLCNLKLRQWMAVISEADFVISVDTAAFHCAGGMNKPLTGIFTFADGQVYGKYFDFFLVQKHRALDPCWTCGPCYNWGDCPKSKAMQKPCLTEITSAMILEKADLMLEKWGKEAAPSLDYLWRPER